MPKKPGNEANPKIDIVRVVCLSCCYLYCCPTGRKWVKIGDLSPSRAGETVLLRGRVHASRSTGEGGREEGGREEGRREGGSEGGREGGRRE